MDVYEALIAENKKTLRLLNRLDGTNGKPEKQRALVQRARLHIEAVNRAEDEVLYSILRRHADTRAATDASQEENEELRDLLDELCSMDPTDPGFQARVAALHGQLRRHVVREENKLFPLAQRVVPREHASTLVDRLQEAKREAEKGLSSQSQSRSASSRTMGQ